MITRLEPGAEPIQGYRLICRLGGGGYGDVWKCEAPGGLNKAIKFVFGQLGTSDNVLGQDAEDGRAAQELKSLERIKMIRHPFILALDRYEIIDGQLMIVSELADCSLYDRFRECYQKQLPGIPREELLNYLLEAAEALDYMTEKHDLLHLDIKPQNLFLMCNHIKIGDFGLVKDIQDKLANVTGGFTANYAAPESFEGYVSRYSDQYSLAIVYQELLTAVRPYSGTNPKQLLLQHIQGQPNLEPLPECDRKIVGKALAKDPAHRWPSSMAMVKALVNAADYADIVTEVASERNTSVQIDSSESEQRVSLTGPPSGPRYSEHSSPPPRIHEPVVKVRTANLHELGIISAKHGIATLRPVILIGLGQFGRASLQAIRNELHVLLGSSEYPLIRTLAIDVDSTKPGKDLVEYKDTEDLLAMPLNRPAHYIRRRDDMPSVETWLSPEVLYRMPRSLMTNGIRSLGRLAFMEHYNQFTVRFQRELELATSKEAMEHACTLTGLTRKTTDPLVYIFTHLAGGTGSGMFLDCACVVRSLLRKNHFANHEVGGVFFLPVPSDNQTADLPEANAVAALHELHHFQQGGEAIRTQYQAKKEPLVTNVAPFDVCLFVDMPSSALQPHPELQVASGATINLMARALCRTLVTPLGSLADPFWLHQSTGSLYQSIGTRVVASPRWQIIQHAANAMCNHVIDHWLKAMGSEQAAEAQAQAKKLVQSDLLHAKSITKVLEAAIADVLQMSFDQYVAKIIKPLMVPIKDRLPYPAEVESPLNEVINILGSNKADDSISVSMLQPATKVSRFARAAGEQIIEKAFQQIRAIVTQCVDTANQRLSFADELIRQVGNLLDELVRYHGKIAEQQQAKFAEALGQLKTDIREYERLRQTAKFRWPKLPAAGEWLKIIFEARRQAFLNEYIVNIYGSLRNSCTGLVQELRHCRTKLLDVRQVRYLHNELSQENLDRKVRSRTWLVPFGFSDLFQVVQQVIEQTTANEMEVLDERLQVSMSKQSSRLLQLTHSSNEVLFPLRKLLINEIVNYLAETVPLEDVAAVFLEQHQNVAQAIATLAAETQIPLSLPVNTEAYEVSFVMLPQSESSRLIEQEINRNIPDLVTLQATNSEEIVIYRSVLGVQLYELCIFQEQCLQVYETAKTIENFTPHSRSDIHHWQNPMTQVPTANLSKLQKPVAVA